MIYGASLQSSLLTANSVLAASMLPLSGGVSSSVPVLASSDLSEYYRRLRGIILPDAPREDAPIDVMTEWDVVTLTARAREAEEADVRLQTTEVLVRIAREHTDRHVITLATGSLANIVVRSRDPHTIQYALDSLYDIALNGASPAQVNGAIVALGAIAVASSLIPIASMAIEALMQVGLHRQRTEYAKNISELLAQLAEDVQLSDGLQTAAGIAFQTIKNTLITTSIEDVATYLALAIGDDVKQAQRAIQALYASGLGHADELISQASITAIQDIAEVAPERLIKRWTIESLLERGLKQRQQTNVATGIAVILGLVAKHHPGNVTSEVVEVLMQMGFQNRHPLLLCKVAHSLAQISIHGPEKIASEAIHALRIGAQQEDSPLSHAFKKALREVEQQAASRAGDATVDDFPVLTD